MAAPSWRPIGVTNIRNQSGAPAKNPDTRVDDDFLARRVAAQQARRRPTLSTLNQAVVLAWRAAPRLFMLGLGIELCSGLLGYILVEKAFGLTSSVFTAAGQRSGLERLIPQGLVIMLVACGIGLARTGSGLIGVRLNNIVAIVGRTIVLDAAVETELASFESPEFLDCLRRADDNQRYLSTLGLNLISLGSTTAQMIGVGTALLVLQPILALPIFLAVIPVMLGNVRIGQETFSLQKSLVRVLRQQRYFQEVMQGRGEAKEIRAYGLGDVLRARWSAAAHSVAAAQFKLAQRQQIRQLLLSAASALTASLTLILIVTFVFRGAMTPAQATVAFGATSQLRAQLSVGAQTLTLLHSSAVFLDDLTYLRSVRPPATSATPAASFSRLSIRDLSFTYPGATSPALEIDQLELDAGQILAVVGENGSGKSTFAKLLASLYQPNRGMILWDDVGYQSWDRSLEAARREQTTVLFQDFVRWELSVRDNVSWGRPSASNLADQSIHEALRKAGATSFVEQLPDGLDTILSKVLVKGSDLSGGQWQRIALARAYFRDAPLLILDEPTAALDPRAEFAFYDSVRQLAAGKTLVLISHRLASVRMANRILVLDKGSVAEYGSHEQLLRREGIYRQLYDMQASAYGVEATPKAEQILLSGYGLEGT